MKKLNFILATLFFTATLNAENCCKNKICNKYYLSGSALLWDADEEGLDFVFENDLGTDSVTDASLKQLSPKWACGYRVEAGASLPCYGLETGVAWTHFSSHAQKEAEAPFGGALFSVWTAPNNLTSPTSGSGEWDLSMNMFLLELGKTFCLNQCVAITPNIGLVGASINQSIDFNFNGGVSYGGAYPVIDDNIRMTNNYWGIGLRAGINGKWQWTNCFGLYTKGALSILNGNFYVKQSESVQFSGVNGYTNLLDIKDTYYRARILAELGLGIYWETTIRSCGRFTLQLGWEQLYFFGQNQLNRFTTSQSPGVHVATDGDLSLQGITVRGTFFF